VHLAGTEYWEEVNSMAYDNTNNKLYVATGDGLKVSSNDGATFTDADGVPKEKGACVRAGSDGTIIYSDLGAEGTV
jgi:ligand-binding sensor domain-containing protein